MQVKERLDVFGGIPWDVLADSACDSMTDVEGALCWFGFPWDDMQKSGLTPEAVGSPDTVSHRLLVIRAPDWKSGEQYRLVVNSTAIMKLQSVQSPPARPPMQATSTPGKSISGLMKSAPGLTKLARHRAGAVPNVGCFLGPDALPAVDACSNAWSPRSMT